MNLATGNLNTANQMKTENKIEVVVCDLGGVLIDLNWQSSAADLFGQHLSERMLLEKWLGLAAVKRFEAGLIDFEKFYEEFRQENPIEMNLQQFRRRFISIIGSVKPGCEEVLGQIRKKCQLALLSNTNSLHIEHLCSFSNLTNWFDRLFLSYQMGMVKPSAEIFRAVAAELNASPQKILFFDDSPANIQAAAACGFNAFVVKGPAEIAEITARFLNC